MKIKKIAASIAAVIALGIGSISATEAYELAAIHTNKIDRKPRTNGVPPDAWTHMELGSIVDRHAEAAGVPGWLARAVVHVESDWDQSMTGHAGEIGLMQIMPETARYMGFSDQLDALYDPDTNIRWGVLYLAEAWRLARGNLCQTILKYNSGHNATKMTEAAGKYCARVRGLIPTETAAAF